MLSGLTDAVLAILKLFGAFIFIPWAKVIFNQKINLQGSLTAFSEGFADAPSLNADVQGTKKGECDRSPEKKESESEGN